MRKFAGLFVDEIFLNMANFNATVKLLNKDKSSISESF